MELAWYFYPLFFIAGLLAGLINTLAGNGSVFTLSLLLFTGMPAGLANGTNRVGGFVQCLVSVITFRKADKFKPLLKVVQPLCHDVLPIIKTFTGFVLR